MKENPAHIAQLIIENFDNNDVIDISRMYVKLFHDLGDDYFSFVVDCIFSQLVNKLKDR